MVTPTDQGKNGKTSVRDALRFGEREYTKSFSALQVALSQITLKPDDSVIAVDGIASALCDFLFQRRESISLGLVCNVESSKALFPHSVSVAILSMMMAGKLGWEDKQIAQVAVAALCHDLGKLKVPETILNKRIELSKSEDNFLKMHAQYGHDQLKSCDAFNQIVRTVALQHHELNDGSGYPKGLKGDKLLPLSKLIGVANAFEESLHFHTGIKPLAPDVSLNKLKKVAGKKYEAEYVQALSDCLGEYPPGALVRLSDKTHALVVGVNSQHPDQPHVIIYQRGKTLSYAPVLSLANVENLTVDSIISVHDLSGSQQAFFNTGKFTGYCFLN